MTIFRYRGKWKAEVYVSGKKRKTKSGFRTKAEAERWKVQYINDFLSGRISQESSLNQVVMDEVIERFINDHLPTTRSSTRTRYLVDIEHRILPWFKGLRVSDVSMSNLDLFRSGLIRRGELSRKSINNCCNLLRSILNKAVEWGYIEHSPYRLKSLKVDRKKYPWWDEQGQVRKFLSMIAGHPHEGAFRLALERGMRLGEIVGLSKEDISFDLGTIHVHRQWDDKEKRYGPTKHNNDRWLKFDPSSDLGRSLQRACENSPHPEALFCTSTGRRIGARKLSGDVFQKLIRKADLPKICFHGLRHTYASWYMIQIGDIWSLMQTLGHSDLKTTMRYSHVSGKHLRLEELSWEGGKVSTLQKDSLSNHSHDSRNVVKSFRY